MLSWPALNSPPFLPPPTWSAVIWFLLVAHLVGVALVLTIGVRRVAAVPFGIAAVHAIEQTPDGLRGGADPGLDGVALVV